MNGETSPYLSPKANSAKGKEETLFEGDDVPLAQRKRTRNEGPDKKKIKLSAPSRQVERMQSPSQPKPKPDVSPYKPHMNSAIKREPPSPLKQSSQMKSPYPATAQTGTKLTSPVKLLNSKPSNAESDDNDDVPLSARAVIKQSSPKVKVEPNSILAKAESGSKKAMNSGKKSKKVEKSLKSDNKVKNAFVKKKRVADSTKVVPKKEVDSDDNEPLSARVKKSPKNKTSAKPASASSNKKPNATVSRKRKKSGTSDSESDDEPLAKTAKKKATKSEKKNVASGSPKKKVKKEQNEGKAEKEKKKEEERKDVWKWWEEEQLPEGVKWLHMEHKGPYFPPPYEPLPNNVKFFYDGEPLKLSLPAEEVACFYAKMLDHDYTSKDIFNKNFFEDWRGEMTSEERKIIKDLKKCDFKEMHQYFTQKAEERKNWTKEQKQELKKENEGIINEYGYCLMDGHKQRVGNFKIEPPGLFRGRGDHPKQGKLKKRTMPEDVIINIGEGAKIPVAPEGHKWQKVIHDNKVSWLACWVENVQGSYKYVMLNPTSRLKGEKDWQKYETARKLKNCVQRIREDYRRDWKDKEMRIRQRGVALYFIDKLALRAGHEKDEETADTVGCCSLRFEHIKLHEQWEDKEYVVEFDFLGKDSVRYWNFVPVEKKVFKNLSIFMKQKSDGDDLFDRLTTTSLNKYLSELMEGLTAKVFRTYNASMTLQDQLDKLTKPEENVNAKMLTYNRANRAVAILCNHQRTVPKSFEKTMSNLQTKISEKKTTIKDTKKEVKELKSNLKECKDEKTVKQLEKKKAQVQRLEEQLFKLEVTATDKEENKEIALGTSKLNYLDPRITVAWCKKHDVPVEKTYNKTQREKFAWAIDMAGSDFVF